MNREKRGMGDLFLATVVFAVLVGAAYLFTIKENGAESKNLKLTEDLQSQVTTLETKLMNTRLDVAKLTGLCEGLIKKFDEVEEHAKSADHAAKILLQTSAKPITVNFQPLKVEIVRSTKPKTGLPLAPPTEERKVPPSNLLERAGIKKKSARNEKGYTNGHV